MLLAPSVHEALAADPTFVLRHGYTCSGHATACTAALACLDITEDEGLLADMRGVAGVWGVSVLEGVEPVAVRDRVLDAGVVIRPIAPATLAICPPLVISDDELDEMLVHCAARWSDLHGTRHTERTAMKAVLNVVDGKTPRPGRSTPRLRCPGPRTSTLRTAPRPERARGGATPRRPSAPGRCCASPMRSRRAPTISCPWSRRTPASR